MLVDVTAIGPAIVILIQEILIGAVLGLTARLTISALEVAGSVIAQQLGLGFVTAIDPTQGEQGMLVGNFLTMLAITLFFATDTHQRDRRCDAAAGARHAGDGGGIPPD